MDKKQKARELFDKMLDSIKGLEGQEWWDAAKQCALIAVDLALSYMPDKIHGWIDMPHNIVVVDNYEKQFMKEVRNEIENF